MEFKNRYLSFLNIVLVLLLFSIILSIAPAFADNLESDPEWVFGDKFWPPRPTRGGTLRLASPTYIGVLNPNHFPVTDWLTMSFLYEKLIVHDGAYRASVPWLAESWEYLDPVTVLMKLRKGIRFHDGTEFNAENLAYQMEWIMEPRNAAWTKSLLKPIQSVEVVDEYTVKWHFKEPWGAFAGTMASVPGFMISTRALKADAALREMKTLTRRVKGAKRALLKLKNNVQKTQSERRKITEQMSKDLVEAENKVEKIENRLQELKHLVKDAKPLDQYPVGTGQFMLDDANPGNYIQLKRNPSWWYGKTIGHPDMPYFDKVRVSVIPDPSIRFASLKAGKLDSAEIKAFQYKILRDDRRFNVFVGPLNWSVYLMLNQNGKACKDIRVRKAISHAIDREALVKGTQFGLGRVASCIFPTGHWARNPNLQPIQYDPVLAKKLLIEAGYGDGLRLKGFALNIPETATLAKAIMGMLENVEIHWEVETLGVSGMAEPFTRRNFDIAVGIWQWVYEPDMIVSSLYHPDGILNNGRNHNNEAIALIQAGRSEINEEKRKKIYQELEKVLYKNYEDIWLYYPLTMIGSSMNLRGIELKSLKENGEGYYFSHPMWFRDGHP